MIWTKFAVFNSCKKRILTILTLFLLSSNLFSQIELKVVNLDSIIIYTREIQYLDSYIQKVKDSLKTIEKNWAVKATNRYSKYLNGCGYSTENLEKIQKMMDQEEKAFLAFIAYQTDTLNLFYEDCKSTILGDIIAELKEENILKSNLLLLNKDSLLYYDPKMEFTKEIQELIKVRFKDEILGRKFIDRIKIVSKKYNLNNRLNTQYPKF